MELETMPIYEYECTSCHHQFDLLQKANDEPEHICPQCSQDTLKKLISAAGFQLKGTGWYATDFKNKGNPAANSDSSKSDSSPKVPETKPTDAVSSPTSVTPKKDNKSESK